MYKYDKDTGEAAKVGDRVEFCHTGSSMDGIEGRIGGWGDPAKMIALVILNEPTRVYDHDKLEVVSMPVVCLKPAWPNRRHESHKSVRSSDASTFDLICDDCGATDSVPGGWGSLRKPCRPGN